MGPNYIRNCDNKVQNRIALKTQLKLTNNEVDQRVVTPVKPDQLVSLKHSGMTDHKTPKTSLVPSVSEIQI